jgi:DNA-binding MarR family transcriptional regulator
MTIHHMPQVRPTDPDSIADQLILAAEAVVRYRTAAYRDRFCLTEMQYRLLMHVAQHGAVSLTQLSQMVGRDTAQVSRTVRSLVDAGLMTSARRRGRVAVDIALSAAGRRTFSEMAKVGEEWQAAIGDALSPGDITLVVDTIERLHDAANQLAERKGAGPSQPPAPRGCHRPEGVALP